VLVLLALRRGTLRFGELRRVIGGVSDKMLTQTLVALERDGFVSRTPYAVIPPRVDYDLTQMGAALALRVESLVRFIEGNMNAVGAAHQAYDRRHS
jgi:DNA-binding HxlR family transcriptional regulator